MIKNIKYNTYKSDIYYVLYGKKYVAHSQAKCMTHVFESVLQEHPQKLDEVLSKLNCLSETDYNALQFVESPDSSLTPYSQIPSGFRSCKTLLIGKRKLCLGTSYNKKDKLRYIYSLLSICGEPKNCFVYGITPVDQAYRIDEKYKQPAVDSLLHYRLFDKEQITNQSDFMFNIFAQCFLQKPETIEWALMNLDCIVEEHSGMDTLARRKMGFRTYRLLTVGERSFLIGTSFSLADKLNRINRYLRAMGFESNVYELLPMKNHSSIMEMGHIQHQVVEVVLESVRQSKAKANLGYVAMAPGTGLTTTLLRTLQTLQKETLDRWAYLLVTDTVSEVKQLAQRLDSMSLLFHEVESQQTLTAERWEPNSITISTIQKFRGIEPGNQLSPQTAVPVLTEQPLLVILCNPRSLSPKAHMAALYCSFVNAKFLAFCSGLLEAEEASWIGPCLYDYGFEQAVNDGQLLPVRVKCDVSLEVGSIQLNTNHLPLDKWLPDNALDIILEMIEVRRGKKIMIVCPSVSALQWLVEKLKALFVTDVYSMTTLMHNNDRDNEIKGFRQAQQAVVCVVDMWTGLDIPELETILVLRPIHNRWTLLQMAAKVARPMADKKYGELVLLLGASEAVLAGWDLPLIIEKQGINSALEQADIEKFNALYSKLRLAIGNNSFEKAFFMLDELGELNEDRCRRLREDLAFLFQPETSLAENRSYWDAHRDVVERRAAIWFALTGDMCKPQNNEPLEMPEEEEEAPLPAPARESAGRPQAIGAAFERSLQSLLEELLTTGERTVQIEEFRHQQSGLQFGFDLRCTYLDSSGQPCCCVFECKDTARIDMYDVMGKLNQMRLSKRTVHHWVMVSPNGRKSNDLDAFMDILMKDVARGNYEPVQSVQIWTAEERVEELFALLPDVYDVYYPAGHMAPRGWCKEKREEVVIQWRKRLKPELMLPTAWKEYLYDPARLLAAQEDSRTYESIFGAHLPIRCVDQDGVRINETAEDYILDWLERPTPQGAAAETMFVLGDFGDGKSFLTYTLSRLLIERFIQAPANSCLPLRLLLSDFQPGVLPQDFLCMRLQQFGADVSDWQTLTQNYQVVVILDGFDEMSTGMDLHSVEENALRLCRLKELFHNTKIIITSRLPVFQLVREKLISFFLSPKVIRLLPFSFRDKMDRLIEFAQKNGCMERLQQFRATHDIMGLASKPLFFDMIRHLLLDDGTVEPGGLSLYSAFTQGTMERKLQIQFWRDDFLINKESTLAAVDTLLEKYALIMAQKPGEGIVMREFLQSWNEGKDQSLAATIWKSLTEPVENDEEDAGRRLTSRTLLKQGKNGYVFCHRSMQEYYMAKGLCRLLCTQPQKVQEYLYCTDISYETTRFLAGLLKHLDTLPEKNVRQALSNMVTAVRGCDGSDEKAARLGATALSLYYAAWKQLPEIDWRRLVLNNVILAGADLSGIDFSGTSFRYANLDNVKLEGTNLSYCNLTGVRLDETKELLAICSVDEEQPYLFALYGDGVLRKWKNFQEPQYDVLSGGEEFMGITTLLGSMILYSDMRLCFGAAQADKIVHQGGITELEDTRICDMNDKQLVFIKDNQLGLYDLTDRSYILSGYPVENSTEAVLLGSNAVLVYHDRKGVRIVAPDSDNGCRTSVVKVQHDTAGLTSAAVILSEDDDTFMLCCGYSTGQLSLYACSLEGGEPETHLLNEVNIGHAVRNVAFQPPQTIACASQNGAMHIFDITADRSLRERSQCKLKIQCKGCIIDGLEPRSQHDALSAYISESSGELRL